MNVKIILESGLVERRDLRSGRIYREGSLPEYGVVFTSNEDKSEDDLGLDTNLILNAFIGTTEDPIEDRDLFFEILGGYFYHDNYPNTGITTNVFGIALESQFGIEEGGVKTLDDNWKLDDPQKPILDESYWTKQFGKHHGWTFIVTLKEREKYPTSDEELRIFAYCPEIKEIVFEVGNCEYDPQLNQLKRKIIFKTLIGDEEPRKWSWQFGDGGSDSGTGKPPESIEHLYEAKPGSVPKLCLIGHQACDEICQEIELIGFEACPECPRIMHIDHISKQKDENITTVDFSLEYSGSKPEKFTWDWGDGSPEETTTESTTSHDYNMLESGPAKYALTVTASGPDECQDSGQKTIEIPQKVICPKIKEMKVTFGECKTADQKRIRKVSFAPLVEGDTPGQWILDFGDGSTESGDGAPPPSIDHFYEKKPAIAPQLILIGPIPCQETKWEINLTGFEECPPCPQITSVAPTGKDKDENYKTVEFVVAIDGIKPDKFEWDWGDSSPTEMTTEPTGSHDYQMLETGPQKYTVSVTSFGPEDCQDSEQIEVEIPQKVMCPEIKEIKITYGECKTENEKRHRNVSFAPLVEGDQPDNWTWDFGDGTSKTGEGFPPDTIEHFYEKKPQYAPKLCLSGPTPCKETCKEVDFSEFEECPPCPRLTGCKTAMRDKDENTKLVEFTVEFDRGKPDKFEWDWGDGSPKETTTESKALHEYKIPATGIVRHTITVTSFGPEDCQDSEKATIEIPARKRPEEPKLCFFMPLLVAFLLAATFATLITYNVAKIYQKLQNYELFVPVAIILAMITVLAIIFWYRIRKRKSCPGSILCDWLGIGWIVFSVGMLISLYLKSYSATSWWTVIVIFFIVAVILFMLWLRKCRIRVIKLIAHLIVCVLALAFVLYLLLAFHILR